MGNNATTEVIKA